MIYFENKCVARAYLIGVLYYLHVDVSVNLNEQIMSTIGSKRLRDRVSQKYLWHLRLDHIEEDRLNKLEKDDLIEVLTFESYPVCESCLQKKLAKLTFVGYGEKTTEILVLVYIDVCGPFDVQARSGYLYFITFIDDYSQYGYVYLMRHKSEVFEKFKVFKYEVEKQIKKFIKILQSDRGGKNLNEEF